MSDMPARARLERVLLRARHLEEEGLPFPTDKIHRSIDAALRAGRQAEAAGLLTSTEHLLDVTYQKWAPIRDLLTRDDRIREVAVQLGVDIPALDGGVSTPRDLLKNGPLSDALLSRVRTLTSGSVRATSDEILKYGISESRKLGTRIRAASQRGEDVAETTEAFRRLVRTIGARAAVEVGDRLVELRRSVARIPSAPAFPVPMSDEEREVVLEARHLARRIHRIKRKALDAPSAARLMTHVRAALSEDRRYGTPQEEVEELWGEVARLTREHLADSGLVPPGSAPGVHDEEISRVRRRPAASSPSDVDEGSEAPPKAAGP